MTTAQIQTLNSPPSSQIAQQNSLKWLNNQFVSFEDFQTYYELENLVQEAQSRSQELNSQVTSIRASAKRCSRSLP